MNKRVCDTKVTHKQTREVPGSSYSSFRNEPVNLGTSRATPVFFPLPNAAPDISSSYSCATSLRLSGECGPCSCASQPPPRLSDCHRLFQAQVLPVPGGWLRPLNHDGFKCYIKQFGINPIGRGDNDRERPATTFNEEATFFVPFLARSVGFGPISSPPPRAFPRAVSAACQHHSTAPSSSHSSTNSAQIFSNNPICAYR
jgi:hypothetical protein